jgi:cobalt-zinc-cadmium efflux system membrane fusion protein
MNASRLSVLVGLLLVACGREHPPPAPTPPPGEVWLTAAQMTSTRLAVEPARARRLPTEVVTSGKITFDDLRVTHVSSPVTGRVTRIEAQPGQRVPRAAALAVIVSPDVGSASSDLLKAGADLSVARRDARRQRELYGANAGSQRDFEEAEGAYTRALAEFERARRKARLLQATRPAAAGEYTLRAPIEGDVVARAVNPGMEVQGLYDGGDAPALFTIGELDAVWVVADVHERDLGRVKPGAAVTVRVVAYPERRFTGQADWLSADLDPKTRTAKMRSRLANPDRALKPEMYATVAIAVDAGEVLAVPRAAILRLENQTMAFVERGPAPGGRTRFQRRSLTVKDQPEATYVQVEEGLQAGERIVVAGALLLSEML